MKNIPELLLLLFPLIIAVKIQADDFTYTINPDDTVNITGYTGSDSVILIPDNIEGKIVAGIGAATFDNCNNLAAITVNSGNSAYSSVDGVLFDRNQAALIKCPARKSGTYTIPGSVISIRDKAFQQCGSLTNITIPSSVTVIGAYAFQRCTNLTALTIPAGVTTIGYKALDGCSSLATISVGSGNSVYSTVDGILFNLSQTVLVKCPAGRVGNYTIPSTVTAIGDAAFNGCANLTLITIPFGVASIGNYAFQYCTNLVTLAIPNSVSTIGDAAFDNCTALTGMAIPLGVTNIGEKAFNSCSNLAAITVNSGNPVYSSMDGVLFNFHQTTLIEYPEGKTGGNYSIPNSVIVIGEAALDNCSRLTGITIPSGVAAIGDNAFDNCTNLTAFAVNSGNSVFSSVDGALFDFSQATLIKYQPGKAGSYAIPNTATIIGDEAFAGCSRLSAVTIPQGVFSIGDSVFDYCTNLAAISVSSGNPAFSSADGVLFNFNQTSLIKYPAGKAGSYAIPNGVTNIANKAFQLCSGLTGVTIPATVVNVGNLAFDRCVSLTGITIPYSVAVIGDASFDNCTNLTAFAVGLGNSHYSSVDGVLFDFNQIALMEYPAGKAGSYTIPNTVNTIGNVAFNNCPHLTGITIPTSVAAVGYKAFNTQAGLVSVTIPDSVGNIGDETFRPNGSLISATLGKGIYSIGDGAFSLCPGLMGVYFEGNAPGLGLSVFESDNNATVYYLPGTAGWGQTFGGRPTAVWDNTTGASVKANGLKGAITINYPEILSITVAMNADGYVGIPVDWWAVAQAGSSWYYLNAAFQWTQFDGNLLNCRPIHQGALFNLPDLEVLNMAGLAVGSYTFWFAVNYPMNGILDITKPILVDSVNVTIK